MTTMLNEGAKTRLQWVVSHLQRLMDGGWLRYEGEQVFKEAMAELSDIIANGDEPQQVQEGPVYSVVDIDTLMGRITDEIEKSDLAVMDAVAQVHAAVQAAQAN